MRCFADHAQLIKHLDEANCLKPTACADPPAKHVYHHHSVRIGHHTSASIITTPSCICLCACTWATPRSGKVSPPPEHAQRGLYTVAVGANDRATSYAYVCSALEGVDVPEGHRLELYRWCRCGYPQLAQPSQAPHGIHQSGQVSICALRMTPYDESALRSATRCDLGCKAWGADQARGHCHLSFRFHGAVRGHCNMHAKTPTHIVVWLHTLSGYNDKVVLTIIHSLQICHTPHDMVLPWSWRSSTRRCTSSRYSNGCVGKLIHGASSTVAHLQGGTLPVRSGKPPTPNHMLSFSPNTAITTAVFTCTV